jgi:nucleotide-binding universal stress UspA family protein
MTLEKEHKSQMTKENRKPPTIVWAIDPFEGKAKPHPLEVENWMRWITETGAQLQPVYVLNLSTPSHTGGEQIQYDIHERARVDKAVRDYLQEVGCHSSLAPVVLSIHDLSSIAIVERVIQYSLQLGAKALIVSSRGRKGFDRFILGSIAENLLFQSPLPIIYLTHQHPPISPVTQNTVLLPTDFSAHSQKVFENFLPAAKQGGEEILLYHAVGLPVSGLGENAMISDNYFSDQEKWAKVELEKWIELAKSKGVTAHSNVEYVGISGNTASAIIEMAKKASVRFIVLASSSGKIGSVFFGSVARELFRANLFSIMAYGPKLSEVLC